MEIGTAIFLHCGNMQSLGDISKSTHFFLTSKVKHCSYKKQTRQMQKGGNLVTVIVISKQRQLGPCTGGDGRCHVLSSQLALKPARLAVSGQGSS